MNISFRTFFVFNLFFLLPFFYSMAFAASVGESRVEKATRLVYAVKIDREAVLSLAGSTFPNIDRRGMKYIDFCKCLNSVDTKRISNMLISLIGEEMTSRELDEALYFFESPTGKKYINYEFENFYRDLGFPIDIKQEKFSVEEESEIVEFSKSVVAKKLDVDFIFKNYPSLSKSFYTQLREIAKVCIQKTH